MKQIELTKGYITIVDDEDFDWLNQWRWYASVGGIKNNKPYAARKALRHTPTGRQEHILMHRLILNAPPDKMGDHINGDSLDNRRRNLRLATSQQPAQNRRPKSTSLSQYAGITWHKKAQKWQAQIGLNGKVLYIGLFGDEINAAKAYDAKAIELFGSFACLNFSQEYSL